MAKEINTNIKLIETLPSPATLLKELPGNEKLTESVIQARETIANIVRGDDSRFLAIVGPCSIHEIRCRANLRRAASKTGHDGLRPNRHRNAYLL